LSDAREDGADGVDKKPSGPVFDPSFKPSHWADASIFYGAAKTVDLDAQIQKKFAALTSKARSMRGRGSVDGSAVNVNVADGSLKELASTTSQHASGQPEKAEADAEEQADNGEEEEVPAGETIPEGHFLLGYGPKTIEMVQQAIDTSFKLFWDGSVGLYIDTVIASRNNQDVLNTVLEMRTRTNDDEEPPVTLLHGQETEKVLRQSLMRIKIEQQEALDAKRRAAEEQQAQEEEDEDEMEDNDDMDLADETEEKITTFQEDLDIITDFSCFTSSEFTSKIMQGANLKCMLSFGEHKKPSKEQVDEDLHILEDI
jgi:hypothetical protein